jgi:hypothetical protein
MGFGFWWSKHFCFAIAFRLRAARSVIDNIFVLKIINKKIWEYNQRVQYLFLDFQKAYDSIHRDTLCECMKEFKITTKLIQMHPGKL